MHSQTGTFLEDFEWGAYLCRLELTIYFQVSDFHPCTRNQDCYGGEVTITGLSVDSALLTDSDGEREACRCERALIGQAVLDERTDWLVDECAEAVE